MKATKIRNGERGLRKAERLVGKVIVGGYPAANYHGAKLRYECRRVLVSAVRLIRNQPLETETRILDPMLRRSRVLVTGLDIDKDAERSFYLGSFQTWRALDRDDDLARPEYRHKVFIVEKPDDWEPQTPLDLPPEFEVHNERTARAAMSLAHGFNSREMREPIGFWAVT